ncbi:MAG: alkaline phosphatase family protein [Bacteroidota bacterium]|nr:alkaline phosphatase family protein [Bacteroidota bacterium]
MMHNAKIFLIGLVFSFSLLPATLEAELPVAGATTKPHLIIFISVDQMREDYFSRFANECTGGLKRLYSEGVFYTNADLNYATSVTCLGHAAMSTGVYPRTSGIQENEWIDPVSRKPVYCVEDSAAGMVDGEGGGFSPNNLLVTAIGDWLKRASPKSKVIAVSGKDRAAILMGGKHPDYAFWYDRKTGHMVTSDYYTKEIPPWVHAFNNSNWIERHVPDAWTLMRSQKIYADDEPDSFSAENNWWGKSKSFPHVFDPQRKAEEIMISPYNDMLVLDFAKEAIQNEELGTRGAADLLCLSLSNTDYIGHDFGPNSREMHDNILRLDSSLGAFFDSAEKIVGKSHVLVVLTADHGVQPFPEYLTEHAHKTAETIEVGTKSERVVPERIIFKKQIQPKLDSLDKALQTQWGMHSSLFEEHGFLNYTAAAQAGVDSLQLEHAIRGGLLSIHGIADVFFRRELVERTMPPRPFLKYFQRSYYAPRGEDYQIRYEPYTLIASRGTGTTHGSTYRYDTHIPIVFWDAEMKPRHISRRIQSVDIAPTLAHLLGVPYPRSVDGLPLKEIR